MAKMPKYGGNAQIWRKCLKMEKMPMYGLNTKYVENAQIWDKCPNMEKMPQNGIYA